jgi:hypothetical protein
MRELPSQQAHEGASPGGQFDPIRHALQSDEPAYHRLQVALSGRLSRVVGARHNTATPPSSVWGLPVGGCLAMSRPDVLFARLKELPWLTALSRGHNGKCKSV